MNAYLVINKDKCQPEEVQEIRGALSESGWHEVDRPEAARLVVVLGGDGTIIDSARRLVSYAIPIAGINFGKLGYLATFSPTSFRDYLRLPHSMGSPSLEHFRDYPLSTRMMLAIHGTDMDQEWDHIAVNDCVIDIGPPFRTTELQIEINGYQFASIRGDGIIISTPTGSTAYNMSAGGPIVQPELESIALTPKNPHRLSIRPIVVTSDAVITITIPKPEGVFAIIDGQVVIPIPTAGKITVRRAKCVMNLIQDANYWQTLTQKLHWGK